MSSFSRAGRPCGAHLSSSRPSVGRWKFSLWNGHLLPKHSMYGMYTRQRDRNIPMYRLSSCATCLPFHLKNQPKRTMCAQLEDQVHRNSFQYRQYILSGSLLFYLPKRSKQALVPSTPVLVRVPTPPGDEGT